MDNLARFLRLTSRLESDPTKIQAGWTHLHVAVHSNHLEAVERFLDDGDDATAIDRNGETALHLAASSTDRDEIACTLLERCTRDEARRLLDAKSRDRGWTALHVAAANDAFTIVSLLLGFGANFEARDNEDRRPIDVAKEPMLRKLLRDVELDWRYAESTNFNDAHARFQSRKSFELDASICSRNVRGCTMLQSIVISGDVDAVEKMAELRLFGHKVDPPIELVRSAARFGACIDDVKARHRALSRMCDEDADLDPTRVLEQGTRLLKAALEATRCYQGDQMQLAVIEETLEALQYGGEVDGEDARYHRALSTNRKPDLYSFLDILQITILGPLAMLSKLICTVYLGLAAHKNDLAAIDRCLLGKPDVNVQDVNGWTPLHHAVYNNNVAMVRRLLESRADATSVTKKNGKTPLHMAVKSESTAIVEVLVNQANYQEYANAKCGPKGFTSLHIAAKTGRLDVVKLLLGKGANFRAVDEKGKLAVDLVKDSEVRGFLYLVGELFEKAENGEDDVVQKLKGLKRDEATIVMNARNDEGCDLLSIVEMKFNGDIVSRVQAILKEAVENTGKKIDL